MNAWGEIQLASITVALLMPAVSVAQPTPVGSATTTISYDTATGPASFSGVFDFNGTLGSQVLLAGAANIASFNSAGNQASVFGRRTALLNQHPEVLLPQESLVSHAFFKASVNQEFFGDLSAGGRITISVEGIQFDGPATILKDTLMLHAAWRADQADLLDDFYIHLQNHHTATLPFRDLDAFLDVGLFSDLPTPNYVQAADGLEWLVTGNGTNTISLSVTFPYELLKHLEETGQVVPPGLPAPQGFLEPYHFHVEYVASGPGCVVDQDCDDGIVCTFDLCDESTNTCSNNPIAACCEAASECDDGVKCTEDLCEQACCYQVGFCFPNFPSEDCVATGGAVMATCTNDPIDGCCSGDFDCDDGSNCTLDICDLATNTCSNDPIPCCCASDSDCDDGLKCTEDICDLVTDCCNNEPIAGCCTSGSDCDDWLKCTLDVCDVVSNTCSNEPIDGCCASDEDCDDGVKCTLDVCDLASNTCSNDPIDGCCVSDADCDDELKCTSDVCDLVTNTCSNEQIVGCCSSNADCDDSDECTTDACDLATNSCSNVEDANCCRNDAECDDGDECTADVCSNNVCEHSEIPGCRDLPTVSEWGIIVMSMLLLIGARICFGRPGDVPGSRARS